MAEQTYYQILGVSPTASQSVIEAAYLRLIRVYRTDPFGGVGRGLPSLSQSRTVEQIEEAYETLRSPARRTQYDAQLSGFKGNAAAEYGQASRDRSATSGAWLAEQRHEDGEVFFRIGWAADFTAVRTALEERIPPSDRRLSATDEWRISSAYAGVLTELFDNYDPPVVMPPNRLTAAIYQRKEYEPTLSRPFTPWASWPLILVAALVVAIGLVLVFPAPDEAELAIQATATAEALVSLNIEAAEDTFDLTPTPEPILLLPTTLIFPSVNLRSGPGTDFDTLGLMNSEEQYLAIGRTVDNAWFLLSTGLGIGWAAAFTLDIEGESTALPVYRPGDELPTAVPTPTDAPAAP